MNKQITFHINNMAYTINVSEDMEKELTKYLELDKNSDTKELLAAYLKITHEYVTLKNEVEAISNKLSKF